MKLTAAKAGENRIMKSPSPVAGFCFEGEKAGDESDHDDHDKGNTFGEGTVRQNLRRHRQRSRSKRLSQQLENRRLDLEPCGMRRLWLCRKKCFRLLEWQSFLSKLASDV